MPRPPCRLAFLLAVMLAFPPAPAVAATMWFLSDTRLCTLAERVVVGDIISVHSELMPDRMRVRTRARLSVVEYVKAPATPVAELDIVAIGGVAGGIETRRPGAPRFVKGERVLVFLAPSGDDAFQVVGLTRGKYRVQPGNGSDPETVRLDLDGLTQLDPTTGREIPADLIPASAGRVYLSDMVATLRQSLAR